MQSIILARRKKQTKQKENEKRVAASSIDDNARCHCHLCELYDLQSKHAKSKILFSSHAILSVLSGMRFGMHDVFFHKWCWYAKRKKYLRGAQAVHTVFYRALCSKLILRKWFKLAVVRKIV